jgi:hypothetical protein
LLVFTGIHQWPPKELIPDIFTWLRFDAMRQKAIPDNRTEINSFIEENDVIASKYAKDNNPVKQQETYIKMMHYLNGLTDVAPLQSEINRLANEKDVIDWHKRQKQLRALEQELQQKYVPEIETKDIGWWTKEADKLHSMCVQSSNTETNAVYKRLLGYLSLNCYMYSNSTLKQGDLDAASKFIEIYGLIDPTNSEAPYLAAKIAASNHNPDIMFNKLEQAFELGFKDKERLKSDVDFKDFHKDERFIKLIQLK